MKPDFSLAKYEELCRALLAAGYKTLTIRQYLEEPTPDNYVAIIRHDVDRSPRDALQMALLERCLGIESTYYFRRTNNVYHPDIIRCISEMNHEIGYHYETLAQTAGDYEGALALFESALNDFRRITEIKTISMHGRPLSKFDSRWLWNNYDWHNFGLTGEAYLSIDYTTVEYFCDTGRTWNSQRYNIRDHVDQPRLHEINTTNDLIALLNSKQLARVCISCHPNRWPEGKLGWVASWCADWAVNGVKLIVKTFRPAR